MPELDTYHCIRHYAENPNDATAVLGFHLLAKRAERCAMWKALIGFGVDLLEVATNVNLGANPSKGTKASAPLTADTIMAMSRDRQLELFSACCKSAGVDFDLKTLVSEQQPKGK